MLEQAITFRDFVRVWMEYERKHPMYGNSDHKIDPPPASADSYWEGGLYLLYDFLDRDLYEKEDLIGILSGFVRSFGGLHHPWTVRELRQYKMHHILIQFNKYLIENGYMSVDVDYRDI